MASYVKLLAQEYVTTSAWSVSLDATEHPLSLAEITANSLLVSALLRGIVCFSAVLRDGFDPLMLHMLYPVVEKSGVANHIVKQVFFFLLLVLFYFIKKTILAPFTFCGHNKQRITRLQWSFWGFHNHHNTYKSVGITSQRTTNSFTPTFLSFILKQPLAYKYK